jgi:spore coat polysaccharide biosynthesis protein SpsF
MVIGCIVQARMGSIRLPGKVLMNVDEKTFVLHSLITQLKNCKFLEKIVIATTNLKDDDKIEKFVTSMNIECFRGSQNDVLDRYYRCAQKFSFSTIVRITADNPLIDPTLVDDVIKIFNSNSFDYVSNAHIRSFPYGTETEVFSFNALEKVWQNAETNNEREHVTPYFYNHPDKFNIYDVINKENLSHLRWTVDTDIDLKLVQIIFSKIKNRPILMNDILDLFSKEPNLIKINTNVTKN